MDANAWPRFDGKQVGLRARLEKRRRQSTDDLQAAGGAVKRRPIVSDFGNVVKSNPSTDASDTGRDVARKPISYGQRIDPALLLSKAKDAMKTPTRPKPTDRRPMDPPAFLPSRPGPADASSSSSSKATVNAKPPNSGLFKPPQPPNRPNASSFNNTTPITSRTFRLDRILPAVANLKPVASPARKVVPFNELPKPKPVFNSPSTKSPKTDLRVLSAPNFSLGARIAPSGLKSMSELNQPFDVDFESDVWGDNTDDVFGSSENRELTRGLLVSPEKAGAKGKKFVKGGLAERAQTVVTRSRTSYTLWKSDIEVQLASISSKSTHSNEPPSLSTYRRALRPDLILRVSSVLQETRISGTSRGAGALRSVLTRCTVMEAAKDASLSTSPFEDSPISTMVLFSFSPEIHGGVAVTSSDPVFDMVDGTELFIWKPIHEVAMSGDLGGEGKTLLCSRFLAISGAHLN